MNKYGSCYDCKYRGTIPGSCHSRCNLIQEAANSAGEPEQGPRLEMLIALGSATLGNADTGEELIKLDPHGVANGWAAWPVDFDPVWVNECPFFTIKSKKEGE